MVEKKLPRRAFLKRTSMAAAAVGAASFPNNANGAESTPGKRIGFVDLNLDNYHANVFLQAMRGPLRESGFTLAGATGTQAAPSRAWASKNQVPYFDDVAALNSAVDFFMVLAPSNPEVHFDLCQRVLPLGRPTYVDKTFAPDYATAKKIFALADQHKTPVQTASALRYTNVQMVASKAGAQIEHMITWGGGGSYDEYAIHPLELLISVMGSEATSLMRRGTPERSQLLVEFSGGRTGVVNVFAQTSTPFAASLTTRKATEYVEVDVSKIFVNNLAAILEFFTSARQNVDRRESLCVMKLLEVARDPKARHGFVPLA